MGFTVQYIVYSYIANHEYIWCLNFENFRDVPKEFLSDFEAEDSNAEVKMEALKSRVRNSPLERIDGYIYFLNVQISS